MELPLTPLDFARRTRRLYANREAVVDGDLRLTYAQFFDRCDRWSQVLQQRLGVGHGDRVAYIAPNTHAQLESFYAVPQLGAVLVPINYRNAYMNVVGTLVHVSMTPGDVYLLTLPMFHANGWTYTWIVSAVGAKHICLRRIEPKRVFELSRLEHVTMLCAAPTVLIGLASASAEDRGELPKGVRVVTAGAPPAAATIGRIEGEFGWEITQVYGLTETAPFITICEPRLEHASLSLDARAVIKSRQGVELITSGELTVHDDNGREVPWDG